MSYLLDLEAISRVSWYPGHMLKAQREIGEKLKLIDVVVIVVDARLPYTSWNSELLERIGGKQRIVWVNKQDLADAETTSTWVDWYRQQGMLVAGGDATKSKTRGKLLHLLKLAAARRTGARARLRTACRAMVIGVPNVGKSSLINCLVGRPQAKTGPTPGVTRRQQWVPIGKDFELLDTPGVMVPRVADGVAGLRLGLIAAIKDRICGEDLLAKYLFHWWAERDWLADLADFYGVEALPENGDALLDLLAAKWGFLQGEGRVDRTKAAQRILQDFRAGRLRATTFEQPNDLVEDSSAGDSRPAR